MIDLEEEAAPAVEEGIEAEIAIETVAAGVQDVIGIGIRRKKEVEVGIGIGIGTRIDVAIEAGAETTVTGREVEVAVAEKTPDEIEQSQGITTNIMLYDHATHGSR